MNQLRMYIRTHILVATAENEHNMQTCAIYMFHLYIVHELIKSGFMNPGTIQKNCMYFNYLYALYLLMVLFETDNFAK